MPLAAMLAMAEMGKTVEMERFLEVHIAEVAVAVLVVLGELAEVALGQVSAKLADRVEQLLREGQVFPKTHLQVATTVMAMWGKMEGKVQPGKQWGMFISLEL